MSFLKTILLMFDGGVSMLFGNYDQAICCFVGAIAVHFVLDSNEKENE